MYKVTYQGSISTLGGTEYEGNLTGVALRQLEAKEDIAQPWEDDGETGVFFVPYHAIEGTFFEYSAEETSDPTDANCAFDCDLTVTPTEITIDLDVSEASTVEISGDMASYETSDPALSVATGPTGYLVIATDEVDGYIRFYSSSGCYVDVHVVATGGSTPT